MANVNTNAFTEVLGKATKETGQYIKNAIKGQTFEGSDKAINKVFSTLGNNFFGVPEAIYRASTGDGLAALGKTFKDEAGNLKYGKIAGSYIGASAIGRVASGGGIYKDGEGRTNLIGVPFV